MANPPSFRVGVHILHKRRLDLRLGLMLYYKLVGAGVAYLLFGSAKVVTFFA